MLLLSSFTLVDHCNIAKEFKIKYRQKIKLYRKFLADKEAEERAYQERLAEVARLEEERLEEERQMKLYKERQTKLKLEKERKAKFEAKRQSQKGGKPKDKTVVIAEGAKNEGV